jgi:hypothetical protein
MSNTNETVVLYLAAWSEPDAKRRRELVSKVGPTEEPTSMVREKGRDTTESAR